MVDTASLRILDKTMLGHNSHSEENPEPRKLQGQSLLKYSQRQINHLNTLLRNRFLCRGSGLFTVAPSGHGKSVFTAQASIELACGLPTFGIPNPNGPLKSLIIQAEDDEDDITEMSQIIDHLKLSADQRQLVDENTHAEFVNDLIGTDFLNAVDGFLNQYKADLIWINPYTAYTGCDIKDDGANTKFLRNGLNPILTSHKCGAVVIHHTPKTNYRDTSEWKPSDWMYSGAGAAVLTNWARAYLVIDPCETHGLYKFIAAKRGKRIGWGDHFPVYETGWRHCNEENKLLWESVDKADFAAADKSGPKTPDDLFKIIPILDPVLQEELFLVTAKKDGPCPIGQKKVREYLKILENDKKIFIHPIPRADVDGKKVKSGIGYARTPYAN
jgi:hypothetical protein